MSIDSCQKVLEHEISEAVNYLRVAADPKHRFDGRESALFIAARALASASLAFGRLKHEMDPIASSWRERAEKAEAEIARVISCVEAPAQVEAFGEASAPTISIVIDDQAHVIVSSELGFDLIAMLAGKSTSRLITWSTSKESGTLRRGQSIVAEDGMKFTVEQGPASEAPVGLL